MHSEQPNPDRRKLLRAAALVTAASPFASFRGYARERESSRSPLLEAGTFTTGIDDIEVYYEVRGSGPLMIIQNGMWLDTFPNYFTAPLMSELAKHHTVLTFDPRGQGRTSAGQGPITYGRFAADTVRLMDKLGIGSAHFIGHSDGGCIQLHLLTDFCDRVTTATLLGTPYSHSAYSEKTREWFANWFDEMLRGVELKNGPGLDELRKRYAAVSPHPERFDEMRLEQRKCWSTEPNFSLRQLATIKRPVLVIAAGDDKSVPLRQFEILAENIPGAERVYFPQMGHEIEPYVGEIAEAAAAFAARKRSS